MAPRDRKKIQKSSKNPPVTFSNLENHSQSQSNNETFIVIHSSIFKSKKKPQKIHVKLKRKSGEIKEKNNSPIPVRRSGRKRISPRAYWCTDGGDALDSDIWQKFKEVFSDLSVKEKEKIENIERKK